MPSLISIRINPELLQATKANANRLHLSQTEYIRQAIEMMNKKTEKEMRRKRLQEASLLVRQESMTINAEFSEIEDDPKA